MSHEHCCNLCGALDGHHRDGRLGRYQVTCDACEARKGSHLVKTVHGYANQAVVGPREPVAA
jgi:hypothetical protein